MSDNFFKNLSSSILNAELKITETKTQLRDSKHSAILDYVVISDGNGQYNVDKKRCKEVGINPEDAIKEYIDLKLKDISSEIRG